MKKLFVAVALVSMASAHAAQEVKFGDLNYLIEQGRSNLALQVESRSYEENLAGTTTEREGFYADALYTYGVSDRLNLYAGLSYQYDVKTKSETVPTDSHFTNDGLTNPVVGGIIRLLDQGTSGFNGDLGVTARINVMDEERGDASGPDSKDGNAADGRHSVDLFGRLGNKWNEANEWQLVAGALHHFEGEYDQHAAGGGKTTVDVDASTDFYVRAAYQYRPVNEWMMALIAQATRVGERTEETGGVDSDFDEHLDYDFTFRAQYLITENFIANFTYGQTLYPDYDVDTAEVKRRMGSRWGLGLSWLF